MLIGALYALCIVMPLAAVAFGPGDHAAHCFSEEQLGLVQVHQAHTGPGHVHAHGEAHAKTHVHPDGTTHRHDAAHPSGTGDNDDGAAACCGLFGLTAMAVDPQLNLGAPARNSSILALSFEKLTGRGPDRINRPPISLLLP